METMTQDAPVKHATVDQVATAAFEAQIAADPRADEVDWLRCQVSAKALGFVIDDDAQDDLEDMVDRLWSDHRCSPRPVGERRPYARDGSNGVPGWFAICDHQGYYGNVQFQLRSDAELLCFWRTQDLEEGEGSYCPALIEEDGGTRCDI